MRSLSGFQTLQPGPSKPEAGGPAVVHDPSPKRPELPFACYHIPSGFLPHSVLERLWKVISIFLEDKEAV